jgi:hypothetical protein
MKTYEQLAASGYAAYCKQALRDDTEGLAAYAPTWEHADEGTKQCWIEATRQIVAEAALVH